MSYARLAVYATHTYMSVHMCICVFVCVSPEVKQLSCFLELAFPMPKYKVSPVGSWLINLIYKELPKIK